MVVVGGLGEHHFVIGKLENVLQNFGDFGEVLRLIAEVLHQEVHHLDH